MSYNLSVNEIMISKHFNDNFIVYIGPHHSRSNLRLSLIDQKLYLFLKFNRLLTHSLCYLLLHDGM